MSLTPTTNSLCVSSNFNSPFKNMLAKSPWTHPNFTCKSPSFSVFSRDYLSSLCFYFMIGLIAFRLQQITPQTSRALLGVRKKPILGFAWFLLLSIIYQYNSPINAQLSFLKWYYLIWVEISCSFYCVLFFIRSSS